MKKQLLVLLFFFSAVAAFAQQTITGVVTSSEDGMPVIGASVVVKGDASQGTITDIDGKYSIKAPENSILVFSFVGLETQNVKVGKQPVINVVMKSSSIMVDEVVVTAMGVKAEKKKLNYAVQSLDSKEIMGGASTNFMNTLQGKVSGLSVTNSGGSPNADTQINIRGISSINPGQSNSPLLIIDGIAVSGVSVASQLNPMDIENMTVLKGAAASALYGQDAANGVIMITTKNGKEGKITVNGGVSYLTEAVAYYPKFQKSYVPGGRGIISSGTPVGGWGPMLQENEMTYDNIGNFFQRGSTQKYDVNVSGGTEKYSVYGSFGYSRAEGVVPNDYQDRMNFLLKGTYSLSKWLKVSMSANLIKTKSRGAGDVLGSVYSWPINDDIRNYQNADGTPRWLYNLNGLNDTEKQGVALSPLWSRHNDQQERNAFRNIIMGSVNWTPVKNLELSGRVSLDNNNYESDSKTAPLFRREDFISPGDVPLNKFGGYEYSQSRSQQISVQALATYKVNITEALNLNLLAGYELKEVKSNELSTGGDGFIVPGFQGMSNIDPLEIGKNTTLTHRLRRELGYFGEIRFDYKGIAHISATGRNDYSSTLSERSYFYPSVTGGVIFTELFKISNNIFNYGKLRGNWAKVGKGTVPYAFDKRFVIKGSFPDQGFGIDPTKSRAQWLDPEMAGSWEIGLDLRFFNDKTKFDIAYFSTSVENQIVPVRVSPTQGNILQTRNEGALENKGLEVQWNQVIIQNKKLQWDANLNFGYSRSRVTSLPDQIIELQGKQFGDMFPTSYLHGSSTAISGKDYLRTSDGQVICNAEGYPQISPVKGNLIGDREADFLLGISSNIIWNNFTFSFLLDGRKGGDVANITSRSSFSNGQSRFIEKYRNREMVVKGVVKQADGTYTPNTTPIILDQRTLNTYFEPVSSNFIEDGSYIRLSYVTLGYDFSKFLKNTAIKGLGLYLTGRNLFLLTKYTGGDPQINAGSSGGTGLMGIDDAPVPTTRSFSISLNATF